MLLAVPTCHHCPCEFGVVPLPGMGDSIGIDAHSTSLVTGDIVDPKWCDNVDEIAHVFAHRHREALHTWST
jgi:hypothetical protein